MATCILRVRASAPEGAPVSWGLAGMVIFRLSIFCPPEVSTLTYFESTPNLFRRSTVRSILPPSPGASVHGVGGSFATVQPQEGRTQLITTFVLLTFVTEKVKFAAI